ncbi:class I SAM-dependent methyltransferase [Desulfosporosinus sp. OT]|uniref:class I SAM-dependent methyltransferase n=1 Tax=Desulfosporosinus sp. OT TaxID=913865 RepID=UPI000223AE0A|nr:class I SAM-dependent methyltransferase [Desulfosporosinus sp. OT]EGW37570.1 methyltransferase domain protein [Desulfosporosinus sp. OT]
MTKETTDKKELADMMEKTARGPFAPVYPILAERFYRESFLKKGLCIDIGSGGAQLGLAIGKISDFEIISLDINKYALEYARKNAMSMGLGAKFSALCGDVMELPLDSESVDLCVSRGSFWFWEDGVKAFAEIYRIMKPEAKAFIGCGFGTKEILEKVIEQMKALNPEWNAKRLKMFQDNPVEKYEGFLQAAKIKNYTIEDNETGRYIIFSKPLN